MYKVTIDNVDLSTIIETLKIVSGQYQVAGFDTLESSVKVAKNENSLSIAGRNFECSDGENEGEIKILDLVGVGEIEVQLSSALQIAELIRENFVGNVPNRPPNA